MSIFLILSSSNCIRLMANEKSILFDTNLMDLTYTNAILIYLSPFICKYTLHYCDYYSIKYNTKNLILMGSMYVVWILFIINLHSTTPFIFLSTNILSTNRINLIICNNLLLVVAFLIICEFLINLLVI